MTDSATFSHYPLTRGWTLYLNTGMAPDADGVTRVRLSFVHWEQGGPVTFDFDADQAREWGIRMLTWTGPENPSTAGYDEVRTHNGNRLGFNVADGQADLDLWLALPPAGQWAQDTLTANLPVDWEYLHDVAVRLITFAGPDLS